MIKYKILNKNLQETVLLIHGLFATSGFWLQYLQILKNYKLIILEIDFRSIDQFDQYLSSIQKIIDNNSDGPVKAVIAHSLGTLIANRLPPETFVESFEICPVYCATRNGIQDFIKEIQLRLNSSITKEEILGQLKLVDETIATVSSKIQFDPPHLIYIPDADIHFTYRNEHSGKQFQGDHFDIMNAIEDIGQKLNAS